MTHALVQVRMPATTSLPEDVSINTWHFDIAFPDGPDTVLDPLVTFYETVSVFFSTWLSRDTDAAQMLMYRMTDPEPRAPVAGRLWTLSPANEPSELPNEVALCGSFSAAVESGESAARRRGRHYLGPFCYDAAFTDGPRPSGALLSQIADAYEAFVTAAGGAWCVYSPTNSALYPVVRGWLDNEWDTQRRRGRRATTRRNWSI